MRQRPSSVRDLGDFIAARHIQRADEAERNVIGAVWHDWTGLAFGAAINEGCDDPAVFCIDANREAWIQIAHMVCDVVPGFTWPDTLRELIATQPAMMAYLPKEFTPHVWINPCHAAHYAKQVVKLSRERVRIRRVMNMARALAN